MSKDFNLAKAERRIFSAFWQDGLLDLVAGATVVLIGAGWLVNLLLPMLALPIVAMFVWQAVRKRVTEPRLGSVVFSAKRRHDLNHRLVAILLLGLVVGGSLVTSVWWGDLHSTFAQWFAPAIPATILAAMSLSCAAAIALWRFVGYSAFFALAGLIVAAVGLEPWWGLIIGGIAVMICGAVMLSRFIHDFPRLSDESEV